MDYGFKLFVIWGDPASIAGVRHGTQPGLFVPHNCPINDRNYTKGVVNGGNRLVLWFRIWLRR